ncbi:MAG: Cna B-type domain-containing protein, partial [Clostridia bacterium]|nr:Cna B-type domain-containing protein [Clostridia bacterium]
RWEARIDGLDKYENGQLIKYTVEEVKVDGYESKTEGDAETGFTVTNTHTPNPPTGDNSHLVLWIALMIILVAVIVVIAVLRRKKN